jgi:hypothetical protein
MITAAHCAKTLVSAASGGLISIQPYIKLLLPGVVIFFTNIAGRLRVGTGVGALSVVETQAIEEVLKAMNNLFMMFPETDRQSSSSFAKDMLNEVCTHRPSGAWGFAAGPYITA